MKQALTDSIKNIKLGNRSTVKQYITIINERDLQDSVADLAIELVALGIEEGKPLFNTLKKLGNSITHLLDIEIEESDRLAILGAVFVDQMEQLGMVKAEKFSMLEKDGQEQWFLRPLDEMMTFIEEHSKPKLKATLGYQEWTKPVMWVANRKIDIVKRARIYGLLNNYRYSEMPMVYRGLNKLGETEWEVNSGMLVALSCPPGAGNFLPVPISTSDKQVAISAINKNTRTALWLEEVRFKLLEEKGYEEDLANKYAALDAENYRNKHNKDHLEIISQWSKHKDFNRCLEIAKEYEGQKLNFLYSCDSRGRAYCFNQLLLNPQGADFAKALLQFANPKPVSSYDLMVTLANHGGQDKKSYDDRIAWVQENNEWILEVGRDCWSEASVAWMVDQGIHDETKSRLQFIAAAQEWLRLHIWIEEGNEQDEFLSVIPVAYDATNSGLQILSAIGRDSYVAPYVNICATERPGDIYQLIGDAVAVKKPIDKIETIEPGNKTWRKIVKRNVMTKNYAATRYGMGLQQWEDKPKATKDSTEEVKLWASLEFNECRKLGEVTYDTCSEHLEKAHELMETMKTAASMNDQSVITWKLPSGFLAYQAKDKGEKKQVRVKIGNSKPQLVYYVFSGKPNKAKHRSAIAPDIVHSIDAWLLMTIINELPQGANLAFVHDAFGSDSCHGQDIQEVAKSAYYQVSSRTVMSGILAQVSGGEVIELPEAGDWDPESLFEADYLVC